MEIRNRDRVWIEPGGRCCSGPTHGAEEGDGGELCGRSSSGRGGGGPTHKPRGGAMGCHLGKAAGVARGPSLGRTLPLAGCGNRRRGNGRNGDGERTRRGAGRRGEAIPRAVRHGARRHGHHRRRHQCPETFRGRGRGRGRVSWGGLGGVKGPGCRLGEVARRAPPRESAVGDTLKTDLFVGIGGGLRGDTFINGGQRGIK